MRGKNYKLIAWVIVWAMIITFMPKNAIASDGSVIPEVTAGFDSADQSESEIIENQDVSSEIMNPDLDDENNKVSESSNEETEPTVIMSDVSQNESNGEFEANASLMYGAYYNSIPYIGILVETDGIPATATEYGVMIDDYKYPATSELVNGKFVVDVVNNPQSLIADKEYTAKVYYTENGEDVYEDDGLNFRTPASMLSVNGYYYSDGDNVGYSYTDKGIDVKGKDRNGDWIQSTYSTDGWPMSYGSTITVRHYSPAAVSVYSDKIDAWVVPEISDDGYFVKVKYYIRNVTNAEITDLRFGASADVQIGSVDRAPIRKTEYGLELSDDTNTFALLLNEGYTETPVTTKWFGYYGDAADKVYDNIDAESLSGIDSGASYSWQNINLDPGEIKSYEVMLGVGDANTLESLLKPNATINYANETISGLTAGAVYIITVGSDEYMVTADANGEISISGTDNNARDYVLLGNDISIAETKEIDGVIQVSTPQDISVGTRLNAVIPDYQTPDDTVPELPDDLDITTTDSSITIKAESGQQYSIDDGNTWVMANGDGNVIFTGLNDGTVYNILTRVAATSSSFASESEAFEVKTSKMLTITDVDISGDIQTYDGSAKMLTIYSESATASYSTTLAGPYSATFPECVDAGTYTVYYKLSKEGYHDYYNVAKLEITKGDAVITVDTTTINKTYGDIWSLPVATTNFGTVSCDKVVADMKNVGTYTVTYTVAGTSNYNGDTKSLTVKISPKVVEKPAEDTTVYTYTGAEQTYNVATSDYYTVSGNKRTDAGSQIVTVALKDKTNCVWADGTTADVTFTFAIGKAITTATAPTAKTGLVYSGEAKALVDAGSTTAGTMKYSLDNSNWSSSVPTATNAGEYIIYYKVEANSNYNVNFEGSVNVTVAKADAVITVDTTTINKTYGDTWSLPVATSNFGTVSCDKVVADMKNVDTYTVTYTVAGTSNYNGDTKSLTVKISPKVAEKPAEDTTVYTYTGVEQTYNVAANDIYTVSGNKRTDAGEQTVTVELNDKVNYTWADGSTTDVTFTFAIAKKEVAEPVASGIYTYTGKEQIVNLTGVESFMTVSGNKATNAGNYVVTVTLDDNHKWNSSSDGEIEWSIAKAIPSLTAPEAVANLIYNATAQALTTSGTAVGGEIQFGTTESGVYTTEIPTGENADNYEVWYKVVGDSNHTDTVPVKIDASIAPKSVEGAKVGTFNPMTYDTTEQIPFATVTIDGLTAIGAWSPVTNVNHTTTFTATGNFTGTIANQSTGMAKAKPVVTAPIAKAGLVYNTSAQALVGAGMTTGGTMQYSIDNATWSIEVPSGTNADDYTVFYKVVGDDNYNDIAVQSISVSIAKANMSEDITADGYNGVFDNQAHTISVTIPEGASIKYGTVEGTYDLNDASEYTNVGTYTVYYKVEKENYNSVTDSADVIITTKDIASAEITLGEALTFNGAAQTQTIASATVDGLTITYDVSGNENTNAGDYTLTITGNGNFAGTVQKAYTIAKAAPAQNPEKLTTARVRRGNTLADAKVTNGEFFAVDNVTVLEGTFAWVDDTETINEDVTKTMKFTPNDANYAEIEFGVAVDSYTSSGSGGTTYYTVKFNAGGGSRVSNATVTQNATVTEPEAPEKEGYTFGGWYSDEALTEEYDFDSKVTKNITLYAKWDKNDDEEPDTETHICPSEAFDDLDISQWYHLDTDYVIENGIFKGITENIFEPNTAQTRAMMVTVLYRAEGEPAANKSIPFADVDMGAYYANAVIWGQQNGIIKGYSETEFGPNDNITREQIAAIMFRYAQYKGIDVSVGESTNILSYDDFADISEYAIPSMQWACGSGLIKGRTESTLNPKEKATRAEIAAILHRFIEGNK